MFEDDVFVCENKYNERDKEIRRLKGLKVGQKREAVVCRAVALWLPTGTFLCSMPNRVSVCLSVCLCIDLYTQQCSVA